MKKLSLIPLALVTLIGVVFAATLLPDNSTFPRIPKNPGTIGGALYDLFNADGSAKNTQKLDGKYASGYLQNKDCSGEPINTVWVGVDTAGKGICGHLITPLASIGKFTDIVGGVLVKKGGIGAGTPANLTDDLEPGDIIVTGGGTATITFTDDLSILRLDVATVVELSTGENTSGQSVAQAILSDGRLWGRILTSTGINLGGGGMVAGVRGTSVNIEESTGQYTLAIVDSRYPTNAATLSSTLINDSIGSTINKILPEDSERQVYSESQFIYNSGATTVPTATTAIKTDLLTSSAWVRENMKKDIIYLTGSTNEIRIAEYAAAEPTNSEKNRLCIDYDGPLDGKWMTDLYGCQSMDTLAIADYTRTGSLTMAYNQYMAKPTVSNTCPSASEACFSEISQSCGANEHLVGVRGNCMYPTLAFPVFADNSYPLDNLGNIQEGWSYDCDTPSNISGTERAHNETSSGGANLTIYCAYNSPSSIIPPLPMMGFAYPSGQGYYINTPGQYISYEFDYGVLAGKTITIGLSNLPTGSGNNGYGNAILDLGDNLRVYKKNNAWICKYGPLSGDVAPNCDAVNISPFLVTIIDENTVTIRIKSSVVGITRFIVGNNKQGSFIQPINTSIQSIRIDN